MVVGKEERSPYLISQRVKPGGNTGHLAYGAWNEAENVLASAAGAEIGILDRHSQEVPIRVRRILGRAVRRATGRAILLPPTCGRPSADGYEHVFFISHGLWDLPLLERLRSLRRRGVTLSMWISEVWPSELRDDRVRYECYSMVDHIFVAIKDAAQPFAEIAPGAQVHVLPPAVDVMRFAPLDPFRARGIGVLGIGRRDSRQHQAILEWARSRQALYVYDTVRGKTDRWEDHRDALASWYQHANVAICNYAKHDLPALTGSLREVPGRLFEGLAAGSILLGLPPDEDYQRELFGTEVVEPIAGSDRELSTQLDRFQDPDEVNSIRIRNLALACRGHDWGHRWQAALAAVGLPTPFGLQNRLDDLAKMAAGYEESAGGE